MTKAKFYKVLSEYMKANRGMRKGQAVFNLMCGFNPRKAESLRGSDLDPFYDDSRIEAFVNSCLTSWESWSKVDLTKEILDRMRHFYAQTDGTMKFPSSAEGDLLKMVHILLTMNKEVSRE